MMQSNCIFCFIPLSHVCKRSRFYTFSSINLYSILLIFKFLFSYVAVNMKVEQNFHHILVWRMYIHISAMHVAVFVCSWKMLRMFRNTFAHFCELLKVQEGGVRGAGADLDSEYHWGTILFKTILFNYP